MAARGLLANQYANADALTLHGYQRALRRTQYNQSQQANEANTAVHLALQGLAGLGDGEDIDWSDGSMVDFIDSLPAVAPPHTVDSTPAAPVPSNASYNTGGGSGSAWGNVLSTLSSTLLAPIGLGIGGRISGQNPYVKSITNESPLPSWLPFAIGGGVLIGVFILMKRK